MLNFIDTYWYAIIIVFIILSLIFICIGHIYREQVQLVLKKTFVELPPDTIDWWSISHFALFAIFGFVKPGYPLTATAIGAGFEVVEDFLSSDKTTQLCDCSEPFYAGPDGTPRKKFWCNGLQDDYWYAKHSDIFWNMLGYVTGQAVRTTFF